MTGDREREREPGTAVTALGLGIDGGGTQTRWALANAAGETLGTGHVAGLTALQLGSDAGRARMKEALAELGVAVARTGRPSRVVAGMTGFGDRDREPLTQLLAGALGLGAEAIELGNDVEIAYRDVFAPGGGYLVYAGTGSIAFFQDDSGVFHRAGGLGGILDDAGSGFWIAIQALRHVWRGEDARPGSARATALGRELFARIGGETWDDTRQFVYGGGFEQNRGTIGKLAVGVAAAASEDPAALQILEAAGAELGRLGAILIGRFGPRPVALSGRVVELHPAIQERTRKGLPPGTPFEVRSSEAHVAAARIAARMSVAGG